MELDIYWVEKTGMRTIDYFKKFPGRFELWHVKDMDDFPDKYFKEVGQGVIDYKESFKNLLIKYQEN